MTAASAIFGTTIPLNAALVFERYLALHALLKERVSGEMGGGGRLVFCGLVDERGSCCALAASVAGAASLGVSPDPEILKAAIRNGVCDFMVNTLDEALRILKNEIRKKQPVSVCLQKGLVPVMEELADRGVQPDILALSPEEAALCGPAHQLLVERGAGELPGLPASHLSNRTGVQWSVEGFPALWLPKLDGLAAAVLGDELRGRWLGLAPRYLGRRAHSLRYVGMTAQELKSFLLTIRTAMQDGEIRIPVCVQFDGGEERLAPAV